MAFNFEHRVEQMRQDAIHGGLSPNALFLSQDDFYCFEQLCKEHCVAGGFRPGWIQDPEFNGMKVFPLKYGESKIAQIPNP